MVATGRSAIDLEPAHGAARSVHVQDNQVRDATNFLLAAGGAGVNVGDVWVERNHVTGGRGVSVSPARPGSYAAGSTSSTTSARASRAAVGAALLRFERFDGVEVKGNRQAVRAGVTPIVLLNSCHPDVSGNDFGGASSAPQATGDSTAPGLAPVTSSTTGRAAAADRPNAAARGTRPPRRRAVSPPPRHDATRHGGAPRSLEHDGGSSPVTITLAAVLGSRSRVPAGCWRLQRLRGGAGRAPGPPATKERAKRRA